MNGEKVSLLIAYFLALEIFEFKNMDIAPNLLLASASNVSLSTKNSFVATSYS